MNREDIWHTYNLHKEKNRQRMKERYRIQKGKEVVPRKKDPSKPKGVPRRLRITEPSWVLRPHFGDVQEQVVIDEEVDLSEAIVDYRINNETEVSQEATEAASGLAAVEEGLPEEVISQTVKPDAVDPQRILLEENKQKIDQLIDEMDTESAIVCSQAILTLMNTFRKIPNENKGPVDDSYLNVCADCGTFYRIVERHTCSNGYDTELFN